MTRIAGRPTYQQTYQANRTKIVHQAQKAKRLMGGRFQSQGVSARPLLNESGSVRVDILSALLGGAAGFFIGAHIQFCALKDIIAAEKDVSPEELSFWKFIFDPASSRDYASVAAAGFIGLFAGGGILLLGHKILSQPNGDQQ